jgi:hypothetical protein
MDALTIPVGLGSVLIPVFFLINALFQNNVAFLVFFDQRIEWLLLDDRLVNMVRQLQQQLPLHEIDWKRLCQHFFDTYPLLPFYLGREVREISWNDVIFVRRTMQIRLQDGRLVLAKYIKYIENFREMPCHQFKMNEHHIKCQIRGTGEEVTIPISAIVNHIPSRKDVAEYDQKIAQQKDEEKAAIDAKAAAEASDAFKDQMRQRGAIVDKSSPQRYYPLLSDHLLQILYHLSVRCKVKIGFEYKFNLLIFRLLSFGDQSQFPLPQLSEEKKTEFESFKTKYNNEMVGRVICSKTARYKVPESSEELKQSSDGRSSKSVEALSLPDSYWIQPEEGVEVRELKSGNPMFHHLLTNRKVFEQLVF